VVVVRRRTAAAAVALAIGASMLLGSCVFGGRAEWISVDAIFNDIGDLVRFANVQSSDVKVGTVRAIRLDGYRARVTMRIDLDARIPSNARALIRSTSLLGERFIELIVPSDEPRSDRLFRDGDVIPVDRTERILGIDDTLIKLGRLLEGGTPADLATLINSAAKIMRGREEALGQLFTELRGLSGVLAVRAPDVASAIDSLDGAFRTLAGGRDAISRALSSSADATEILAEQQTNLDRLVGSLDRTSAVLARYMRATRPASDAALKDLRLVLDQVMKTTGDLEQAVAALARFSDLWPRAFPGDYLQLDIVQTLANAPPSATNSAASIAAGRRELRRLNSLAELLWGALR
jgi:phospholipid/cholesterol/gamma-HCH transport system substrate-binding protein